MVIQSGIGKANTAATIQLLVTQFRIQEAVFTGVAGGVDPKKRIGDELISSEAKRKWLEETFNAAAVEMEGAAMAQICEANQISCAVVRTLSDMANESAHVDFHKLAAFAAQNSAKLVDALLKSY